jgi:hypothetical protein
VPSPPNLLPEWRISRVYALCAKGLCGMKLSSCPRRFASLTCDSSSALIADSSSNSSRKCVRIISGPSVAIVNCTWQPAKARKVSRRASSLSSVLSEEIRGRAELEHDPGLDAAWEYAERPGSGTCTPSTAVSLT